MSLDDMIEVLEAAKAGKQIQFRANPEDEWRDYVHTPKFQFGYNEYRVKPEPREWWLEPSFTCDGFYVRKSKDGQHNKPLIHVREVLE